MREAASRDLFGAPLAPVPRREQLPLPLGWPRPAAEQLVIGSSNRAAVELVLRSDWASPAIVLSGPRGSGKSLIGRLFGERGMVLDPLEAADEEMLFHRWNRMKAEGGRMLLVAGSPDAHKAIRLPDLATRLATAQHAVIDQPDPCLARDLVEHLLTARGLHPAANLGEYVSARIDRSYDAIHAAVAAIDAASLASGGAASIRTARAALIDAGLYRPDRAPAGDRP